MHKVLLVDDDQNILFGYKRNLRTKYQILIANGPEEAIKICEKEKSIAVIISDYNMPVMKGSTLLAKVKEIIPNTVRMMLTGFADINIAMQAVNEGEIFRFLTKPCNIDEITKSINDATKQYDLVNAERILLEKTLKGSIKMLIDILSVSNPITFNQASQFRDISKKIMERLGKKNSWEIEISCLLSQIGCIGVPIEIIEKRARGEELEQEESILFFQHAEVGSTLLKNIPRLENISEAISFQFTNFDGSGKGGNKLAGKNIPFIGRLLKICNDYTYLQHKYFHKEKAVTIMQGQKHLYDPELLAALESEIKGAAKGFILSSVNIDKLESGMILAEGIKDQNELLLLPKGTEISNVSLIKIQNYSKLRVIKQPIKVFEKS